MEEEQALLHKNNGNFHRPIPKNVNESQGSSSEGSDEWWEDSHSSCSSCEDSQLSLEWESEVNERGELFYIISDSVSSSDKVDNYDDYQKQGNELELNNDKTGNEKRGRLVSWIRRREAKKIELKQKEDQNIHHEFQNQRISNRGDSKNNLNNRFIEIPLKIESVGEGSTLSEQLLGLTVVHTEKEKVLVASALPDNTLDKYLSNGDILCEINNFNVTPQNLDRILEALILPCEVLLKIQKNQISEELKDCKYQSDLVRSIIEKNELVDNYTEHPIGVVVVDMESQHLNKDDVIYNYPEKCVLSSCRGAFVTLFHLLAEINPGNECQSSSVIMKKQPTHVLYKSENNLLLLVAMPIKKFTLKEATYITQDLIRTLLFCYQTLKRCFENTPKTDLDRLFSLFFSRVLTDGFSSFSIGFSNFEETVTSSLTVGSPQFEDILPHVIWVPLPKEAQIQIDDAFNELEANEIECEESDLLENPRLFHIVGSCFFHKGYLLLSHLPKEDLLDVYSFCRQNCLIQLLRNESVKSLIIWKEVFPNSVSRGAFTRNSSYTVSGGRWFLLIVGEGYDSLAVILEANACCAEVGDNAGPAAAYVEETKDTLRHLQKLGISSLASQWIENNCRFKTITPEEVFARRANKKKENLLGFVKSFDGNSKSPGLNVSSASSKSSDTNSSKRTRNTQLETSEDSVSQTPSNVSEVSDENAPILGRRAERGRTYSEPASDSDSSSSDWDSSRDSNMRESTCSSQVDNFYFGDMGAVIPAKLTTGPENLLFSYINLDGNEGVLVSPPINSRRSTPKMIEIVENFRRCAQIIHSILEHNINFKKNSQNASKGFINKSLVAVKEHGVLFECTSSELDSHKKPQSFSYWIVGRLFFVPQPREVYVCYYDEAPQNLIEIAFRLGLSAAG